MLLKNFLPHPSLRAFVRCYRIVHLRFGSSELPPCKPYSPRPEQCLAFYPYDRERVDFTHRSGSASNIPVVLSGQALSVTNRYVHGNFLVVQIVFQPGGLYRLTGLPGAEINDAYLDAGCVFPKEIHFVNEAFANAGSYTEILHIAHRFIESLVKRAKIAAHPVDSICQMMLSQPAASLDRLARSAYLSPRQFERKFRERTGVSPKVFARLVRFDRAFQEKNLHPGKDWQSIAFDCDYYDYQHLVRDYLDFTGMRPTQFYALESTAPERRFGLVEHYGIGVVNSGN